MSIQVIHGPNQGEYSVAGHSVLEVTKALRDVFNIPDNASAIVNGKVVSKSFILSDGDNLVFHREKGRKGGIQDFWSERELVHFFGADEFQSMKEAGMELASAPVLSSKDVVEWNKWLQDQEHDPSQALNVQVDIKSGSITVDGTVFEIDQQLAAVVQCLLDAKGERRSQRDMREECPQYILDKRLDNTICRKLLKHKSGIGQYVKSNTRGYWFEAPDKCR
jgi:hypothetical protein